MNILTASGSAHAYLQIGRLSLHGHSAQVVAYIVLALVVWQFIAHRSKKRGRSASTGKRPAPGRRR